MSAPSTPESGHTLTDAERAALSLMAVLSLHSSTEEPAPYPLCGRLICRECSKPYPCPTVRLARGKNLAHPCPNGDCPGDGRYAAPGRGHFPDCRHPLDMHGIAREVGREVDQQAAARDLGRRTGISTPPAGKGDPEDSCCTCGTAAAEICHHVTDVSTPPGTERAL